MNSGRVEEIMKLFPNSVTLSSIQNQKDHLQTIETPQILIIDSIGILSSIYQYGHIAYIGGGFGVGIHNTLEAAAFGLPVIFGSNYSKFMEAVELINIGAAFSVKDVEELKVQMEIHSKEENRIKSGSSACEYVNNHTGATQSFLNFIYKKGVN